jgi:hypothetical protein
MIVFFQVGERILYTTTKLDEENWEPVESAREEVMLYVYVPTLGCILMSVLRM